MITVKKIWDNLEEYLLVYSLMFSLGLIFVQVVLRYCLGYSLSWSEELARYLFLWQTWIGASYAVKEHKHLRIDIIQNFIKGEKQKIKFELFILLIWLFFSITIVYQSGILIKLIYLRRQLSPALQLPMAVAYASVCVGCGLMVIRLVQEIMDYIKKLR